MRRPLVNGYFLALAIGNAARDLIYYYFLSEGIDPLLYAFVTVLTVSTLSSIRLSRKPSRDSETHLVPLSFGLLWKLVALGLLSAYLYTFFWSVTVLTPGIFNLVDYSLTPILTAVAGWCIFKERFRASGVTVFFLYIAGLLLLSSDVSARWSAVVFAATYPLATALSDAVTKLVLRDYPTIDENFVIVWRFWLAVPILFGAAILVGTTPVWWYVLISVPVAAILSYVPLVFLVRGLRTATLETLASYDMLIPILTMIGSLPILWKQLGPSSLIAFLILSIAFYLQWRNLRLS